jgi:predicted PurR-regulated permease PerM
LKKLGNEHGAALVLTVMIITLILLFVLMLFTQVTNTARQVKTTEEHLIASHIAEMGVDYYQQLVQESIPNQVSSVEEIITFIPNPTGDPLEKVLDDEGLYKFVIGDITIDDSEDPISIKFSSKGITPGSEYSIDDMEVKISTQTE